MTQVKNPQAKEQVKIELSVNEAMALSGVRFNGNPQVLANAHAKLRMAIEENLDIAHTAINRADTPIDYQTLEI